MEAAAGAGVHTSPGGATATPAIGHTRADVTAAR
jgi:hypothetical protein